MTIALNPDYLSACRAVPPFVHPFAHPFAHPFVHPFVHPYRPPPLQALGIVFPQILMASIQTGVAPLSAEKVQDDDTFYVTICTSRLDDVFKLLHMYYVFLVIIAGVVLARKVSVSVCASCVVCHGLHIARHTSCVVRRLGH